jgi:hypothetical protein
MATWQELEQSIIENHEKVDYAQQTAIRPRIRKALNKAVNHIWSKADWTFKIREVDQFAYDPAGNSNILPDDFLSFQHTGDVHLLQDDGVRSRRQLDYIPIRKMRQLLNGPRRQTGIPKVYSLGGTLDGTGNQRAIFLYPPPNGEVLLKLTYQASAPKCTENTMEQQIPSIPENWHETVIEEVAILFRLMDKSADISAQTAIVSTALEAMKRDEPHGREDVVLLTPAYAWRMNVRFP